jgi:hypothetical protein
MSRVTFSLLTAAAVTIAAAGTANAQCCNSGFAFNAPVAYSGGGCCGTGFAVQAAPIVVQAAPVVVQQPVIVRQPVIVQQQPIVQQYVVNQGPVYSGPALTDYRDPIWYAPRAVGAYPYVAGLGGRYGYRGAYHAPRRHYHRSYHHRRHHGPISVYN